MNDNLNIDTVEKLKLHLKIFKKMMEKNGATQFSLYPMFCMHYDKRKENFKLDKFTVLNTAMDILVDGEE